MVIFYPDLTTGNCDLYMKCKSNIDSDIFYFFPYLESDDAMKSGNYQSYYNCAGWAGGMAEYAWPPWEVPWSNPDRTTPELTAFDNYFGNKNYSGGTSPRYNYAWNYTRGGANSSNNQIDLWSDGSSYSHTSINSRWNNLSLSYPANGMPHGYSWESKIGYGYERIFHPRYALSGTGGYTYGSVVEYYRSDGTVASSGALMKSIPNVGITLEKSIKLGLSSVDNVQISQDEIDKLINLTNRLSKQIKDEFGSKYLTWKKTWKNPEISIHSNPRKYAESIEYEEFLNFCKKNSQSIWPLLFQNYLIGEYLDIIPIRDLVFPHQTDLLIKLSNEYIKPKYTPNGSYIVPSPKTFNTLFIKELLKLSAEDWGGQNTFQESTANKYSSIPQEYILNQNYPNPFNPSTKIKYGLPLESRISIKIFNILGQEVTTLISNEYKEAGWHTIEWNSKDHYGNSVSSGVYFCKFISVEQIKTIKLILIR